MDEMDRLLLAAAKEQTEALPAQPVWEALCRRREREKRLRRNLRQLAAGAAMLALGFLGGMLAGRMAAPAAPAAFYGVPRADGDPAISIPKTDGTPMETPVITVPQVVSDTEAPIPEIGIPKTDGGFLYVVLGDIPLPALPEVERLDELAFTDLAENAFMDSNMNGLQTYLTFPGEEGYILMQLHPAWREYTSAYAENPEVGMGRCSLLVSELTGDIETITWRLRMGEETYLEIVSEHRPFTEMLAFVQGITAK